MHNFVSQLQHKFIFKPVDIQYIDVLDGLRAISIISIAWFHFWQQSWLSTDFDIGSQHLNLDWIPRSGYLFVDVLILLSGFCLFLPYARHLTTGAEYPESRAFFFKRFIRIMPSYWLCLIIVLLCVAIPTNEYAENWSEMRLDILSHLSFTYTFWAETYMGTKLNGVLWTLAIEVQFYLIFPIIAKQFCKQPILVYLSMVTITLLFRKGIVNSSTNISMLVNQLPNFFDVYANGMAGALIYCYCARYYTANMHKNLIAVASTVIAMLIAYHAALMMQELSSLSTNLQVWQSENRFRWSATILGFILTSAFSLTFFRLLLSNAVFVFLSTISYNYFIWHQYIAVRLKLWHFPPSIYENPNMEGDHSWQIMYTCSVIILSILVGASLTYGFERPVANKLRTWKRPHKTLIS